MESSSRVKSAERALDVLELLASRGAIAAREVAAALGLPKSTTHHLLNVMADRGFVTYSAERRTWSLGVATHEIGSAFIRNGHLQQLGMGHLAQLTSQLEVASHLAQLHGTDVIYLDKREPAMSGVRLVTEVGTRLPAHLTAVGRAALSTMETDQLEAVYRNYAWPMRTGEGPGSFDELAEVLKGVRSRGVAIEEGSTTSGICCVAAPLKTGSTTQIALGVAFLEGTRSTEQIEKISAAVLETAERFAAELIRS